MENAKIQAHTNSNANKSQKYYVCIEGAEYPWTDSTISMEEVASLGGWDTTLGVIEIDKDNNERTVSLGEVVELKPGHGFSKKICWKRGFDTERLKEELDTLKNSFPTMEYLADGQWVLIKDYLIGDSWSPPTSDVCFQVPATGYPGTPPYGIYVRVGIKYQGLAPCNYTEPAPTQPPYEGGWGILSWCPGDNAWKPGATAKSGSNLVNWVLGFSQRFKSGQ